MTESRNTFVARMPVCSLKTWGSLGQSIGGTRKLGSHQKETWICVSPSPAPPALPAPTPGGGVPDLQEQTGLHCLPAGNEVGLHEQDVLAQLLWVRGEVCRGNPGRPARWHTGGQGGTHSRSGRDRRCLHGPQDGPRSESSSQARVRTAASRPGLPEERPPSNAPYEREKE